MGNFCSNEESKRQRAADFSSPLGAAAAGTTPASTLSSPHSGFVGADGSPRGRNSVFGFVESNTTERSKDLLDDEDDPGIDDDEEETIEFYNNHASRASAAAATVRVDHDPPCRLPQRALSAERKQQIERMISEEGGDNAAVLRRILAEPQQHPRDPPMKSQTKQTPPVFKEKSQGGTRSTTRVAKKKKKIFGFRHKKKNKTPAKVENVGFEQEPGFTTLVESVQTRVITEESSLGNPSDEENLGGAIQQSPSIPKGIVQRRTTQFAAKVAKPGPLMSVKLKAESTASPDSIKIRSAAESQSSSTLQTTPVMITHQQQQKKSQRRNGGKTKTAQSTASISEHQYSEFQKLQLKAAVAKKQSQKQHKVAKLEDRLKDVQGYRELWQNFEKIQETVEKSVTPGTGKLVVDESVAVPVTEVAVTEANSNSPAPLDDDPDLGSPIVVNHDMEPEDPIPSKQPSVEYDLAEDLGFMKGGGSIASSIRSFTSRKSNRSNGSTDGGRRRRRFRRRSHRIESESEVVVPEAAGDDSFSLKGAEKWYFDFQDEFEHSNGQDVGMDNATTGSNNSQASLSLLSQNSLEAQRRFFAEKRRQRKLKEQRKAVPALVTPSDYTKNGPIAGYGLHAVNKKPEGGGNRQIALDETPISGNLRRDNSTGVADNGLRPAQQLLASKDNPALRLQIAANILKSRSLTNMEVAFSTPESDVGADDASVVSDLDDNLSVTSIGYATNDYGVRRRPSMNSSCSNNNRSSHRRHHNRNDYGVSRRRRPSMTSQSSLGSECGDHSSFGGSDYSEIRVSAYDHEMVLKRRLEIEARLRALKAEDDVENIEELPDTTHVISEYVTSQQSPSSAEAQDDYTLPAVISPRDVRSQRKRGKLSGVVYPTVACDYLASPMFSGIVPTSPTEPVSSAQNASPDGTAAFTTVSTEHVMSPAAKRMSPSSKTTDAARDRSVGVFQKNLSEPSRSDRKDHPPKRSPVKLDDSFGSSVNSRPRITLPYLRAAKATCSKKRTAVTPDDNDSLVTSIVSLSSTTPSSTSGKEHLETAVYEGVGISSEGRGLDGARETLLLADQVEAHVKDVLNRYRSAPEKITTCSDEDDDQPPRIVSSSANWIR